MDINYLGHAVLAALTLGLSAHIRMILVGWYDALDVHEVSSFAFTHFLG